MEKYLKYVLQTEIVEDDLGATREWSVDEFDFKTNRSKTIAQFKEHMDAVKFMFMKQDEHDLFIEASNKSLEKKELFKRLAEL